MKSLIGTLFISILLINCNSVSKLDKILALEDQTDIVIEIGQMLWKKSENDHDFESLNKHEKNVIFIEMLEGQVNNGGFDQYFFNSSGDYVHETLSALEEIKAPITADIFDQAVKAFPVFPIPKDIEKRRKFMEKLPKEIFEKWAALDDKFYDYPENLSELVIEFVKTHRDKFEN